MIDISRDYILIFLSFNTGSCSRVLNEKFSWYHAHIMYSRCTGYWLLSEQTDQISSLWKMPVRTVSLKDGIWKLNRICVQYKILFLCFFPPVPLSCSEGFTELGYYNGTVSQTDSSSPCLKWTEFPDYVQQYPGRGLGEHNFCRNPDRESNPWCFFRQSSGAIGWAYCDCHQGEPYVQCLQLMVCYVPLVSLKYFLRRFPTSQIETTHFCLF